MLRKVVYATQPYLVGSKNRKSLAIIIPARIAKDYHINISTIFAVRAEKRTNRIIMYTVQGKPKDNINATDESCKEKSSDVASRTIGD